MLAVAVQAADATQAVLAFISYRRILDRQLAEFAALEREHLPP